MSTCGDNLCGGMCGYCTSHATWGGTGRHYWHAQDGWGLQPLHVDSDPRPGDSCSECGLIYAEGMPATDPCPEA